MVLTVGNVDSANVKRKGLEPFVRAASYLPEMEFVLVGAWKDNTIEYLQSIATSNVLFTGRVSDKELMDYYRKASVYVQASLHEGFGMSVAESMLAGCIPVVTRAGALPEVVGDTGVYTDSTEPAEIAQAIEIAIKFSTDQRDQARQRVLKMFTLEKRRQLLENLVQLTIGDNDGA
jgi:glycosyltransferase involved in cell wall biosynthesis